MLYFCLIEVEDLQDNGTKGIYTKEWFERKLEELNDKRIKKRR